MEIKSLHITVSALQLHEAWDLLESMKKLVDDDRGRARSLLEAYPQLIGALIEVQVRCKEGNYVYTMK